MPSIDPPLFAARFSPPPVRPPLVLRPHLHARLDQGLQRKLTLVSAPAGYGKTTLLAEWAAVAPLPVAWLALDAEDSDPGRFCAGFWSALDRIHTAPDWPPLAALADLPPQAALQRMLFSLAGADRPLALVLDDYHVLRNPALHPALAAFIDRLPPHLHLFIATRKDPPIPLARLRSLGELVEVRAGHLRFTPAESAAFLEQKMGLHLRPEDHTALARRTEGWAAGLQLAALSLLEHPDPHPFIESISGSHRFILDYLVEEVLEVQPPEIQTFLLHTSVLRRLSAPLCAALTGPAGLSSAAGPSGGPGPGAATATAAATAAGTLAYLERANLFLTPLDPHGRWFRYHHLFAELLQRRLAETTGPEQIADLHRRAAAWYHEAGDPVEAIHHALAGRDPSAAARLMEHWSTDFFKSGALGSYLPLLRALPPAELGQHPQLLQDMGWGLALTHDLEQADHYLNLAEVHLQDQPNLWAENMTGQAYVACFRFDLPRALTLGRRALELLDPENEWMRSVAAMVLGLAHWSTNDPLAAQHAMQMALQSARRANGPRIQKVALAYLGRAQALAMDFLAAEEMLLSALGSDSQPQLSPGNDVPGFDLAALYYEWNDLQAAGRYLDLGFAANEASGNHLSRVAGLRVLARLRMAQGQAAEAWTAAHQAVQLAAEMGLAQSFQNLNAACCVELSLAQGDLDQAGHWSDRILGPEGLDAFHPLPRLAQARLLIARRRPESALRLLSELEALTTGPAWRFARFRLRLLQALADPQHAPARLGPDLPAALRHRLARSFIDLGRPVAAVLQALPPPAEPDLAARFAALLQACAAGPASGPAPASPPAPFAPSASPAVSPSASPAASPAASSPPAGAAPPPLVEPLSERELEVLRLVAAGQSTAAIAAGLFVAESTVRTHLKNIFAKLDAHSRLQAVEQARRHGLI